eukprot:jgi/Mesen1/1549/ME000134S00673
MGKVGKFADIGKKAKDLLNKDYTFDHRFTVQSTTQTGIALTTTGSKKGDLFSSDVKSEFSIAKNAKVELKVNAKSELFTAVTFENLAPGVKVVLSGLIPDDKSGKAEVQYGQENFNVVGIAGLTSQPTLEGSFTVGREAVAAGIDLGYDSTTGKATKYNVAVGLTKPDFSAAVSLVDKGDTIKASYIHTMGPDAAIAAELAHKFQKTDMTFTVGAQYRLDPVTITKVRLNNRGSIAGLVQHEFRPKSHFILSGEIADSKAIEKSAKFGFAVNLKP